MKRYEYCHGCGHDIVEGETIDYVPYPDKTVGPICADCRKKHWVCEKCGEGAYPEDVTFEETHKNCGGECS